MMVCQSNRPENQISGLTAEFLVQAKLASLKYNSKIHDDVFDIYVPASRCHIEVKSCSFNYKTDNYGFAFRHTQLVVGAFDYAVLIAFNKNGNYLDYRSFIVPQEVIIESIIANVERPTLNINLTGKNRAVNQHIVEECEDNWHKLLYKPRSLKSQKTRYAKKILKNRDKRYLVNHPQVKITKGPRTTRCSFTNGWLWECVCCGYSTKKVPHMEQHLNQKSMRKSRVTGKRCMGLKK